MKTVLSGVALTVSLIGAAGCGVAEKPPVRPPVNVVTPDKIIIPGGVDFQGRCDTRVFNEDLTGGTCDSKIDLVAACKFDHRKDEDEKRKVVEFVLRDKGNPKSGVCLDSRRESFGGISDMSGYCAETYAKGDRGKAVAELDGDTWLCRERLDVTALCIEDNNDSRLKAERLGSGLWQCYRYEPA
ncbi:hypothetical protein FHR83_002444 [Actinoplanes campanulatus]|uniref:Uncharacterized protein n=1 Tax=Actinoplanes campanulatus TaxID=113559 RepID=A0A7W5FDX7_9ACTN|nr:hypothetical protein [Actinoplanes campanulatus]MBB3094781.1 hypothetical protein [Actinoplanes campanulatus]GGN07402.1 hypothetical protein GCM10010109_15690 [Actinoplanes campanulatus]GID36075.1 hypothetical protein Aca09nite_25810 [Actinoplanes campanulatus]